MAPGDKTFDYFQRLSQASLFPGHPCRVTMAGWREPERCQDFWDVTFMIPGAVLHESLLGRVLATLQEEIFFSCNLVVVQSPFMITIKEKGIFLCLYALCYYFCLDSYHHTPEFLQETPDRCLSITSLKILQWFSKVWKVRFKFLVH